MTDPKHPCPHCGEQLNYGITLCHKCGTNSIDYVNPNESVPLKTKWTIASLFRYHEYYGINPADNQPERATVDGYFGTRTLTNSEHYTDTYRRRFVRDVLRKEAWYYFTDGTYIKVGGFNPWVKVGGLIAAAVILFEVLFR